MARYDHVIIGSGINALVCAAILSGDSRVLVLEREDVVGGNMRTGELAPGFTYDPLAMTFVLLHVSPAFGPLEIALARHGARFATTDLPTGVLMSDGRSLTMTRDRDANAAAFEALAAGDGATYQREMAGIDADAPLLFGLFNNKLWSLRTFNIITRFLAKKGPRGLGTFFGKALFTQRRRLVTNYQSDLVQALMAPWPLHAGLNVEQPFSGTMGSVVLYALEVLGAPIAKGGAARVPEALTAIIEANRSTVRTGADVDKILPGTDGRDVAGVRLADGEVIDVPSVICSVTPTQLYGRLLADFPLPDAVTDASKSYLYGKGNMQLHYALDRPVEWPDRALQNVQLLHLTDGVDAVSKASNEAERGILPERPTVCVGQPTAADPSRAPDGKAVLWIQLPEAPRTLKGDAKGEIEVPADGVWTETVREAYADRVEAMIAEHVPGFRETVVARKAYSPADLEAMNINLVGGDPYAGWCGIDQFFLFRPLPQQVNYNTAVRNVYQIGASTHPGPGLNGTSGYLLAKTLAPKDAFA